MKSMIDHAAVAVNDINWYIRFFKRAFDMEVREYDGPKENPKQVWMTGGVQLIASSEEAFASQDRCRHLGIAVSDKEECLKRAYEEFDAQEMPQGHNWVRVGDGLCVEVLDIR
ncbi:VOC family protein [Lachnospiraceae bacterium 62-35]